MTLLLRVACLVAAMIFFSGCSDNDSPVSDIASDEHVQFIRSTAWLDDADTWHVTFRGWIYEPEDSVARKAIFEAILQSKFDLEVTDESRENFDRRLNLLIADNERGKQASNSQ